ncbi:MAG: hypothetical protein ACXADY_26695 [Candidatus Hodarchaeales archaeon]|jgi:hypothetical protein
MDIDEIAIGNETKSCYRGCQYNYICCHPTVTWNSGTVKVDVAAGAYCYYGTCVQFSAASFTMNSGEQIWITNTGLVKNSLVPLGDGTSTVQEFNKSGYDWADLFGFMENGKFKYIDIEKNNE